MLYIENHLGDSLRDSSRNFLKVSLGNSLSSFFMYVLLKLAPFEGIVHCAKFHIIVFPRNYLKKYDWTFLQEFVGGS
jgi:hypothetical protein